MVSSTTNPFLHWDWDHCWRVWFPSGEFCSRRASFSPDSGAGFPTVERDSRGDFNPCLFGHLALSSTTNPFLHWDWDHCWRVLFPSGEFCSRRESFSPDSGAGFPTVEQDSRGDFNPCLFGHLALSSTTNLFQRWDWDKRSLSSSPLPAASDHLSASPYQSSPRTYEAAPTPMGW